MARQPPLICEPGMSPITARQDRSFEHVFAALKSDFGIIDLDNLD